MLRLVLLPVVGFPLALLLLRGLAWLDDHTSLMGRRRDDPGRATDADR